MTKRNLSPRTAATGSQPDLKRSKSNHQEDDLQDELDDDQVDPLALFGGAMLGGPTALGLVPTPSSLDLDDALDDVGSQQTSSQPVDLLSQASEEEVEEEKAPVEFWHAFDDLTTLPLPMPSDPVLGTTDPVHPLLQPKRKLTPIDAADTTDYDAARTWLKDDFQGLPVNGTPTTPHRQRVDIQEYDKSSTVPGQIKAATNVPIKGNNQKGMYPDLGKDYKLPGGANYEGQYSSRVLTYMSTVARSALEMEGLPPVEVQFGHAFNKEGAYSLNASTNNLVTQERLAQLLEDPTELVKKVGLARPEDYRGGWEPKPTDRDEPQSDVDARAKHALKLATFPEVQQRRLEAIEEDDEDRDARLYDLALAQQAFDAFSRSDVTVAMSPSTATERGLDDDDFFEAATEKTRKTKESLAAKQQTWKDETVPTYVQNLQEWEKTKKGKKPKPPDRPTTELGKTRHAEQNVAAAVHAANVQRETDGETPFDYVDIQGTMIRCTGCSAELGANVVDEHDHEVTGRLFGTQASVARFCADCLLKEQGTRETVTNSHPVQVPMSPGSPVPSVWEDSQQDDDTVIGNVTNDASQSSQSTSLL